MLELDRKVGEAIDIYVNNRLVARGEVVLVEDKLGVTMTEIIKSDRSVNVMRNQRRDNTRAGYPRRKEAMRLLIVGTLKRPAHHRHQDTPWTRARRSPTPTATIRRSPCCAPAAAPTC